MINLNTRFDYLDVSSKWLSVRAGLSHNKTGSNDKCDGEAPIAWLPE